MQASKIADLSHANTEIQAGGGQSRILFFSSTYFTEDRMDLP